MCSVCCVIPSVERDDRDFWVNIYIIALFLSSRVYPFKAKTEASDYDYDYNNSARGYMGKIIRCKKPYSIWVYGVYPYIGEALIIIYSK